jgi:uncharacterized repeat protein (TIGR03803 family)
VTDVVCSRPNWSAYFMKNIPFHHTAGILAGALICSGANLWGQAIEQPLKSFGVNGDVGGSSQTPLAQGMDGALYGTTTAGGSTLSGTVFKLNPDGTGYAVIHEFGAEGDGLIPDGGLVQTRDGMLYGTTYQGGSSGKGTIFQLNTNGGSYGIIHHFGGTGLGDGQWPFAGLTLSADGGLYGTTYKGGSNGFGTVFRLNSGGSAYSVIHHFGSVTSDGQLPYAGVVQGNDGALYGTTQNGGDSGYGTVFRLGTNGAGFAVLHSFSFGAGVGVNPKAGVTQGSDGALYGTTPSGSNSKGAIYKLNPDGTDYVVLHNFASDDPNDGQVPYAAPMQASDGVLYGTTARGGSAGAGTAYRLNLDGSDYRVLYSFGAPTGDGQQPQAALIQGRDSAFYGTTYLGGDGQKGTVFRLLAGPEFISITQTPDGNVHMTINGFPNIAYRLEASTDLRAWVPAGVFVGTGPKYTFTDLTASLVPGRFYRAVW